MFPREDLSPDAAIEFDSIITRLTDLGFKPDTSMAGDRESKPYVMENTVIIFSLPRRLSGKSVSISEANVGWFVDDWGPWMSGDQFLERLNATFPESVPITPEFSVPTQNPKADLL